MTERNPLAGDDITTADVLASMPEPSWHDRYVKPWGTVALQQQEPSWFAKNVLGGVAKASESLPPGVGDIIMGALLGPRAPVRVPKPIKAYHGSPHDFDKFDLSKIGTGEGAQAYGHGLYFAENEGVARSYRDNLSAPVRKPISPNSFVPEDIAIAFYRSLGQRNGAMHARRMAESNPEQQTAYLRAAEIIEKGDAYANVSPGKMYEVALHATPEQFLDWDKPLSGQPAGKAVEPIVAGMRESESFKNIVRNNPGQPFVDTLMRQTGRKEDVSSALREAGIPGIRYLDQGSRTTHPAQRYADTALERAGGDTEKALRELARARVNDPGDTANIARAARIIQGKEEPVRGTSNYVVWTPEIIEILRKYGIIPPTAAAGMMNALGGQSDQQ